MYWPAFEGRAASGVPAIFAMNEHATPHVSLPDHLFSFICHSVSKTTKSCTHAHSHQQNHFLSQMLLASFILMASTGFRLVSYGPADRAKVEAVQGRGGPGEEAQNPVCFCFLLVCFSALCGRLLCFLPFVASSWGGSRFFGLLLRSPRGAAAERTAQTTPNASLSPWNHVVDGSGSGGFETLGFYRG